MKNKVIFILSIIFFIGLLIGLNVFMNIRTVNDFKENVDVANENIESLTEENVSETEVIKESKIIKVTSTNFESEVINSDKIVLIDFYADWCEPCKIMTPIIEMIAEENENIKVVKIDVDTETNLASKYGAYSIPTFVVIKNGVETNRTAGITKKATLLELIGE